MDEKKILKAIADVSTNLRTEIIKVRTEVIRNREEMITRDEERKEQINGVEKRLTKRIDTIGKSVAYLEEDTPTRQEFEELQKEVETIKEMLKA
jgi:hypothetical protein